MGAWDIYTYMINPLHSSVCTNHAMADEYQGLHGVITAIYISMYEEHVSHDRTHQHAYKPQPRPTNDIQPIESSVHQIQSTRLRMKRSPLAFHTSTPSSSPHLCLSWPGVLFHVPRGLLAGGEGDDGGVPIDLELAGHSAVLRHINGTETHIVFGHDRGFSMSVRVRVCVQICERAFVGVRVDIFIYRDG